MGISPIVTKCEVAEVKMPYVVITSKYDLLF
jgi:hypothetical protein